MMIFQDTRTTLLKVLFYVVLQCIEFVIASLEQNTLTVRLYIITVFTY